MRQERGKAPLMLMEQVVMILVFALAAALCMQAFVTASLLSGKSVQEDHGANISQSIAEVIKEEHGDLESAGKILKGSYSDEKLVLYFDKDWNQVSEKGSAEYTAEAWVTEKGEYFSGATIQVLDMDEKEEIFSLNVGWQEVEGNE